MHLANWTKGASGNKEYARNSQFAWIIWWAAGRFGVWWISINVCMCVCVLWETALTEFFFFDGLFVVIFKNKSEQLRQGGHQLMSGGSSNRKTKNRSINWNMIKCLCVLCACVVVIMCLMFKFQWNKFPKTKQKIILNSVFLFVCCVVVLFATNPNEIKDKQ